MGNANANTEGKRFRAKLNEFGTREKNCFVLRATRHGGECRMGCTHGEGDADETYPNLFCPHHPTPGGSAIVSLTTSQTTPTTYSTNCAMTANDELIRKLRAVAQQNAQLPQQLSKVFAKAVIPLLDVDRRAAQNALGSSSGLALGLSSGPPKGPSSVSAKAQSSGPVKARLLPQASQRSSAGTSTDGSATAYTTAQENTS